MSSITDPNILNIIGEFCDLIFYPDKRSKHKIKKTICLRYDCNPVKLENWIKVFTPYPRTFIQTAIHYRMCFETNRDKLENLIRCFKIGKNSRYMDATSKCMLEYRALYEGLKEKGKRFDVVEDYVPIGKLGLWGLPRQAHYDGTETFRGFSLERTDRYTLKTFPE